MKRKYKVSTNRKAKAVFQNTIFHQGSEARFEEVMIPLSKVLGLQGTGIDETPAFIPFDLVGSEQMLLRYANMYEQFRIDWIEVTFYPVGRPPTHIVTEGNPVTAAALQAWQRHWLIRFPYSTIEDLAEMGTIPITRVMEDPKCLWKPTFTKFKLWWKPRVRSSKPMFWWSDKDSDLQPAAQHVSANIAGAPFPWSPFISTSLAIDGQRSYTTQHLRQPLSEPYVSMVNPAGNRGEAISNCPYKIIIKSGWSFRGYRKMTSQFITSLEEKEPFPADED